ncbi:hypothetical protein PIB30_042232 [Stylosanthes scabra]|uniref:Uncharacterized protein n=1 Tax=Stylosanthes scabra TaxID=79078 RepID=A0ABU6YFF0_9FABA|nr:hypothetical protein [Stylosanthes scabra]
MSLSYHRSPADGVKSPSPASFTRREDQPASPPPPFVCCRCNSSPELYRALELCKTPNLLPLAGLALLIDILRDKNIIAELMKSLAIPKGGLCLRRDLMQAMQNSRKM